MLFPCFSSAPPHGFPTFRQLRNEAMRIGSPRRLLHLRQLRVGGAAVGDVATHGAIEEHRLLFHETNVRAEPSSVKFPCPCRHGDTHGDTPKW